MDKTHIVVKAKMIIDEFTNEINTFNSEKKNHKYLPTLLHSLCGTYKLANLLSFKIINYTMLL